MAPKAQKKATPKPRPKAKAKPKLKPKAEPVIDKLHKGVELVKTALQENKLEVRTDVTKEFRYAAFW